VAHVLILGAASDVAVACAREYASHGYDLYLGGRDMLALTALASDLQIRYHVKAVPLAFDALKFESHLQFYSALQPAPEITICVFDFSGIRPFRKKTGTRAGKLLIRTIRERFQS